jgi:hypothetical protein
MCKRLLIAFPLQQWFRERGPILRYTYIACLVSLHLALLAKKFLAKRQDSRFPGPLKTGAEIRDPSPADCVAHTKGMHCTLRVGV